MNINNISGMESLRVNAVKRTDDIGKPKNEAVPEVGLEENRDKYIPSEENTPIGLYRPSEDENGNPCIDYDAPKSRDKAEKCTANTDKVDREIKELREKAEQLRQQLKTAAEDKRGEIEKQLEAVEKELAQKDNDSYRRANAVFS